MKSFWKKTLGYAPDFPLEARIFNAICLVSAVCLLLNILLNFLLGIPQLVILMVIVFGVSVLCYYLSRFKMKLNPGIVIYVIASNILLIVNFKFNSGINGPSLLIFILSFFLSISIIPPKQYWFWITLNLTLVMTLLAVEYKYPQTVPDTYPDRENRFIDLAYTYIIGAFAIFLVTTTVRKSYLTEKRLVEQKAAELKSANDTMNKLFSILAHDLRSPLASIQNYLEVLTEFKLNEDERSSIQTELLNSTQNTQQMLANLLLWSKSQMSGVTVNLAVLNLKKTLAGTIEIYQAVAAEKAIQLTNELTESIYIKADPDMVQLIIRNLINNALKFTGAGGLIVVSAVATGNYCRISIKDNGQGISYEQQKDIFSLNTESTIGTKKEKGVGLGLLLCKEFTELQGGTITFESVPEEGTTFYVNLQLTAEVDWPGINKAGLKTTQG